MAGRQRLREQERLHLRRDFARVFARRCRADDELLIVYVNRNDLPWSRLGLSVSRRVGNAVRRSYVRRRIREAFRAAKDLLPTGLDMVCVARPEAADPRRDVRGALIRLVAQAARRALSPRSRADRSESSGDGGSIQSARNPRARRP